MPSSKALTNVHTGAGKLHPNVASAAADFEGENSSAAFLASIIAALNREVAEPAVYQVWLTAGATSTTMDGSIYGPIWLGESGKQANDLFDLSGSPSGDRVSDTNLLPISVTSIAGAAVGSNSFTTAIITVNFSGTIAFDGWHYILYSKRATLASFVKGSFATARKFVPAPAALENAFYSILWPYSGLGQWNSTPTISLYDAARSGLGERYSRSNLVDPLAPLGVPGSGALITRTGQAITLRATSTQRDYSFPTPDPYLAHFKTQAGPPAPTTGTSTNYDGGTGYVGVLQQRVTANPNVRTNAQAMTVASRLDVIERYVTSATLGIANTRTKVVPTSTTGTALNPDGGATADDRRTIRIATADFFWQGAAQSEVALGRDMIEVTLPGGETQVYVITTLFGGPHPASPVPAEDARRALVRTLTGDNPNFPSGVATTGVSFRFIKTKHFEGVGSQTYRAVLDGQVDPVLLGDVYHAVTPILSDDPSGAGSNEIDPGQPEFYARSRTPTDNNSLGAKPYALRWGGFNPLLHVQEAKGGLRGDGAVVCSLLSRSNYSYSATGTGTLTWHPTLQGSVLLISVASAGPITLTLDLDPDYVNDVMSDGDEITVIVANSINAPVPGGGGGSVVLTMNWPVWFLFSGRDDIPMQYNDTSITYTVYQGAFSGSLNKFVMRAATYLGPGD